VGNGHLHSCGESRVKTSRVLTCIVGLSFSITATAADSLDFLSGDWSGPGTLSGSETRVTQSWQPALNGAFTNIEHKIWMSTEDGLTLVFEGTGYYREMPDKSLTGVWVASNGNILPLRATAEANTLTVKWGNSETESGKTTYQLLADGRLSAVDSVEDADGNLREFGSAILTRENTSKEESTMAKVTGIGGVFMLANDNAKALSAWYYENLGMQREDFGGVVLQWQEDVANDNGLTVWHIADKDSEWFSPSESRFMINYRVDDLDEMIGQLQANGVEILGGPESHENGKFAWIMDPEGNKIELWEPMLWDDANKAVDP